MATYKSIKYLTLGDAVEHTDSINALTDVDTNTVAPTDGQTIKWNGTNWVPSDITEEEASGTQKALFGFGSVSANAYNGVSGTNVTNLVSSSGVLATDTTGVGTARSNLAAAGYGGDKAIFGFGLASNKTNITNLVSNAGVVATDTTGVGTVRTLSAAGFGGDKAIFGFGFTDGGNTNLTNLVSNAGVVATDTTGVGTALRGRASASFGGDKAIFGFGQASSRTNTTNLVSNLGVVASDSTGVGTARSNQGAAGYGGDKAIFNFGYKSIEGEFGVTSITNLVSNTGVVASDTTSVGTSKELVAGAGYGNDKAIFGFGTYYESYRYVFLNTTNLVSNAGVVASDTTGISGVSSRFGAAAAGYSSTA